MGRKMYFLAVFLLSVGLNFLFAADGNFVDVKKANQDIQALKAENIKIQTDTDAKNAIIQENENKISGWKKIINDQIVPLQNNVNKQVTELRALLATIVDEKMKADASSSLNRGLELLRKLEIKKQILDSSIFNANNTIAENKNIINKNNQKIDANMQRIIVLEASLRNTEQQNFILSEYITNVSDFIGNSESLLSDIKLPAPTAVK